MRGRCLTGEGDLRILGTVEGDVSVRGDVTIAEGGAVRGDSLEAESVTIEGEVSADVSAEGAVIVHGGATVRGKGGSAKALRIDEGASVSADLDCDFELPEELR